MTVFSKQMLAALAISTSMVAMPAFSDTIDPETFSADLGIGESVTIQKTVVIEATGPTAALIDVHFLFDTSGSMGDEIGAAKAAASNLFSSLTTSFGNVSAGVGVFSEGASLTDTDPRGNAVYGVGLSTDAPTFIANVNDVTLSNPDGGGDRPESGYTAIALAGGALDWRDGSNRFMFVFTDADGKGDTAGAIAALAADDITLVTLAYRGTGFQQDTYGDVLGGDVFAATTDADAIVSDVTAGITASLAEYSSVTVDDLGLGNLQGIDVSVVCTGADIGACVLADAVGAYDRSIDRTFTFDVTFERTAAGDASFFTNALVDGGIVAREFDTFADTSVVPLPAGLPLLLTALGVFGFARRRQQA